MMHWWWWLLALWPGAGWVGGVWAWTRMEDMEIQDAIVVGVAGAIAGPLLALDQLWCIWATEIFRRHPMHRVLIRARKR